MKRSLYSKKKKKSSRYKKRSPKRKSTRKRSKVRSTRKRSRSRVRIPIKEKGGLFGYHVDMSAKSRRSLLKRLLSKRKATYSQIIKRLNVISIYNKRRHPETSLKIKRDIDFVHRHYKVRSKSKKRRSKSKKGRSKYI
jgi:hypothetical protein